MIATAARAALADAADPAKAPAMQAYMKTEMPFYGVQAPARRLIARDLARRFAPTSPDAYAQTVRALWSGPSREEKYLALDLAMRFRTFIDAEQMPLYEQLVREGAWWDLVDGVATRLVGGALARDRAALWPTIDAWIDDDDLWIRRTSILCQLEHEAATDADRLLRYCLERAHERAFFIRKAIGWALREYARTDPDAVVDFLRTYEDRLSGLSFREASKHLSLT